MKVAKAVICDECGTRIVLNVRVVDAGQMQNGVLVTWQQLLDSWDRNDQCWYDGPFIPAPHWCKGFHSDYVGGG